MPNIGLHFVESDSIALDSVEFSHPVLDQTRRSARGKGVSAIFYPHTFQWSPAVRALSVLLLWTKANYVLRSDWPGAEIATLSGARGSHAAALDSALSKKPLWLLDMFGIDKRGTTLARNIFLRWNPERKRGGDVIIAVNPNQLEPATIRITVNGHVIEDTYSCISLAAAIDRLDPALASGIQPGQDFEIWEKSLIHGHSPTQREKCSMRFNTTRANR